MDKLTIKLEDLKKVLEWIESKTNKDVFQVYLENGSFYIETFDKKDKNVTFRVYKSDAGYSPDVVYTEKLY